MSFAAPVDEKVPALIVGGGGAGLTASMLLARHGVEHLLVSARATTSDLPKAHVLNQRAMEVLDDVGVAEAIARRSTPAQQMSATAFYAGFTGPDPAYGRRLARLESWGAGGADDFWRAASPWRQLNLPQIRLEPLLKARAENYHPSETYSESGDSPHYPSTAPSPTPIEADARALASRSADGDPQDHPVVGRGTDRVEFRAGRVFLLGDAAHRIRRPAAWA